MIRAKILARGTEGEYYYGTNRFNLRAFWAAHKSIIPLHYAVYVAEVGCKKAAAAKVESVFSGAGKFTTEAKSLGPKLLERMIKLHYNWKYNFLRPSMEEIVKRYNEKFRPTKAAAASTSTAAPAMAAPAPAPAPAPV